MKIIIFLLFVSSPIFSQDSLRYDHSTKNIDTIVIANEGTHKILITNENTFIEKYGGIIGAITGSVIGSFFAALIAFKSIRKTNKNQIKLNEIAHTNQIALEYDKIDKENHQKDKIYYGYLYSIWAIMQGQKSFLITIRKEVNSILNDFKEFGTIGYDKPFNVLPIDLLKESYLHILSDGRYNMHTVNKLISYLSVNDSLTNELNFTVIKKLKNELSNKKDYDDRVDYYFNQVFGHLDILLDTAKQIEDEIMGDINNSETAKEFLIEASKLKDKIEFKEPNN